MLQRYPPLLNHILEGRDYAALLEDESVLGHRRAWRCLVAALATCAPSDDALAERFHIRWHESHHWIREIVDDDALLTRMMWTWLPRYQGPELTLYRGENIDRFQAGRIGSAWTDQWAIAEMFASGLNRIGKGGVILQTLAPAKAIIAGPSTHSLWLGEREFTIDCAKLSKIHPLETFPATFSADY